MRTRSFKPLDKDLNGSNSSFEDCVDQIQAGADGVNYTGTHRGKYKTLNTLTFTYKFENANDTVFFSHFAPYTFDDLEDYLYKVKK
jgi:hypothetical protein